MLLSSLGASLLGPLLAGKGIVKGSTRKCKCIIKNEPRFKEIIYLKQ